MDQIDLEQMEPFPVDREGKPFRAAGERRAEGDGAAGCCEKFQETVSRWMLPEDARSKYLERANCCPPPIFIILISIAEVAHDPHPRRIGRLLFAAAFSRISEAFSLTPGAIVSSLDSAKRLLA